MRSGSFVLAPTLTLLALTLGASGASAQLHLRTQEQIEQDKAKAAEKEQKDKEQQAQSKDGSVAEAAPAAKAGVCLPEGKPAGYGVNTFEDILANASFGLKDLETQPAPAAAEPGTPAEPVVWRAVGESKPEAR